MKNKNERAERLYEELGSADEKYLSEALDSIDAQSFASAKRNEKRRASFLTPAKKKILIAAACIALVIVTVFTVWSAAGKPAPADGEKTAEGGAEKNETPIEGDVRTEASDPIDCPLPSGDGYLTQQTPADHDPEDDRTAPVIDSIDKAIYYGAMAAFDRQKNQKNGNLRVHGRKATRPLNEATPTPPPIDFTPSPNDDPDETKIYDLDPAEKITIYSAYYFSVNLHSGEDFQAITSKVGAGLVKVLVTVNSIDHMITFISEDGDRFYSFLAYSQYEEQGVHYFRFTPSKYVDGGTIVYDPQDETICVTVGVKDGQVVEFSLYTEKKTGETTLHSSGVTILAQGIQMFTNDAFTFTVEELTKYWTSNAFSEPVLHDRETQDPTLVEVSETALFPAGKIRRVGLELSGYGYYVSNGAYVEQIVGLLSSRELNPISFDAAAYCSLTSAVTLFYENGENCRIEFRGDKFLVAQDGRSYVVDDFFEYDKLYALFSDYYFVSEDQQIWIPADSDPTTPTPEMPTPEMPTPEMPTQDMPTEVTSSTWAYPTTEGPVIEYTQTPVTPDETEGPTYTPVEPTPVPTETLTPAITPVEPTPAPERPQIDPWMYSGRSFWYNEYDKMGYRFDYASEREEILARKEAGEEGIVTSGFPSIDQHDGWLTYDCEVLDYIRGMLGENDEIYDIRVDISEKVWKVVLIWDDGLVGGKKTFYVSFRGMALMTVTLPGD